MTRTAGTILALGLWLVIAMPLAAAAQQIRQRPPTPPATSAPAIVPEPQPPAYEPEMLRLAETIGALSFLRQLCNASEAQQWRARMADLLEAEGVTQGRKERLAGAYNRGFKGYGLTYRTCTAAAIEAAIRLSQDGERLTRSLGARFGG